MKRYHKSLFHPAATLAGILLLMLGACTPDALDELPAASGDDADTRPLAIMVSDGGHHPTGQTRAAERDFRTVFTEGDRIGLYTVKDGQVEKSNLCLTLKGGAWTLPAGVPELVYSPARSYYAYYPYKDDGYMNGKVSPGNDDFFALLASNWETKSDQSTYADYTASDLMTARGTCTPAAAGAYTLHFAMEHRMILVVIQAPITKHVYTETIDGRSIEKSYLQYIGVKVPQCWQENSYTARHLLKPEGKAIRTGFGPISYFSSSYTLIDNLNMNIVVPKDLVSPGRYTLHSIGDGKLTESNRPLREGDFYMRDGSIVPQEAFGNGNLPAKVQADCLGVVSWVGENEGRHWTQTKYFYGDYLLMRDHPECTRGMAVALRDASPTAAVWATGEGAGTYLYDWGKGFSGFTHAEQADWEAIDASGAGYGYCRSRLMKLYGAHYPATTFPAYNQIDTYAAAHPAPDGSSGWFFPGQRELAMMCYGMTGNFSEKPTTRRNLLNGLFPKAGGEAFDGRYWSNFEDGTNAWTIDFAGSTAYGNESKSDTHKVRAVIAF